MFGWHKLFFGMVLRQFTVGFKNPFSGLFSLKKKGTTQLTFTCLKSTIETLETGVRYAES